MFMGAKEGGPGTGDPSRIRWEGARLRYVLLDVFGVKPYQLIAPAWLEDARFTFDVKVPAGATPEQAQAMWRNLLRERFHLKDRHENRELRVYALARGAGEIKMKESAAAAAPVDPARAPRYVDRPDGCRMMRGSRMGMTMAPGRLCLCVSGTTMEQLARILTNSLTKPVIDRTGLTAAYDLKLEFEPEAGFLGMPSGEAGAPADPAPPIATALAKQLGLKLENRTARFDVVIVGAIDKIPTEN